MADFKVVGKLVLDDKGQLGILGTKAKKASKNLDAAGTSAHTADRRLKGAAQASSNTSKNFSKMAQGIQGGLVPAYATLAATLFAVSAVFRGLEAAANIKNQIAGMEQFGAITGKNMIGITQGIRDATNGLLDFQTAAQSAAITTAAGFSQTEVTDLAEGAKLASVALGRDLTDSFNRLIRGVTKAEPELLDELGIILRLDVATRKFAEANGLVADKLTIAQRRTAVYNEVMEQINNNFGDFRENADDLTNPFARLQTAFNDIIVSASSLIGPLEFVANFLSKNAGAAATLFLGFAGSILKSAFPALQDMTGAINNFSANAQASASAAETAFKKSAARFKTNAADMVTADKLKTNKMKTILTKLGAFERFQNKSTLKAKRASIQMLIQHEERRAAHVKKLSVQELAHLKMIYKQIEQSHQKMTSRMLAGMQALGSGMATAMIAPVVAAQTATASLASTVLTRLAPAFAILGSAINAAFFIFTTFFIGKMIYDAIFATEEYTKKQEELNAKLDSTGQLLEHASRVAKNQLKGSIDESKKSVVELNKTLVQTARMLQALGGEKSIMETAEQFGIERGARLGTSRGAFDKGSQAVINQVLAQITARAGQETFGAEVNQLLDYIDTAFAGRAGVQFQSDKVRELVSQLDPENPKSLDALIEGLDDRFLHLAKNSSGLLLGQLLDMINPFIQLNTQAAAAGQYVIDLDDAFANLSETMGQVNQKFRPSMLQNYAKQVQGVLDRVDEGNLTSAQIAAIVNETTGMEVDEAGAQRLLSSFREKVGSVAEAPKLQLGLIQSQNELTLLKARKDAVNKLAAIEKQREVFVQQRLISENKIDQLKFQQLATTDPTIKQNLQDKIDLESKSLDLIKKQAEEYDRSMSLIGKMNDAFSQGLEKMFYDLTMGATNFAESFRGLMKMVLIEMAKVAAMKMAASTMSILPFANGGIIPMASGGVINRANSYAAGGIATEPTYLVGEGKYNEAVVPLPNGRSIPVDMNGGGATNVTINIDGSSTGSGGLDANTGKQLGHMIQAATMEIIQREKRPGGVLSR